MLCVFIFLCSLFDFDFLFWFCTKFLVLETYRLNHTSVYRDSSVVCSIWIWWKNFKCKGMLNNILRIPCPWFRWTERVAECSLSTASIKNFWMIPDKNEYRCFSVMESHEWYAKCVVTFLSEAFPLSHLFSSCNHNITYNRNYLFLWCIAALRHSA